MGILVACCRKLHSDEATGCDPVPLDLWFESNRAYQIFPLKKTRLQDTRDLVRNLSEVSILNKPPFLGRFFHCLVAAPVSASPEPDHIRQSARVIAT